MRWSFLLVVVAACAAPASRPAPLPPASPKLFTVAYRPAASAFEVLDNVSRWWPEKCDAEYRADWEKRFGVSAADELAFGRYQEIRRRYYAVSPATEGGLFAPRKPADRLAEAFYGADTIEGALATLATFATADDVLALRAFYAAFTPQLDALAAESKAYVGFATALDERLNDPKTAAYAQKIAHVYHVPSAPPLRVLYVWWPPVDHVTANHRGTFLLMKYNPSQHAEDAVRDVDVPIHELAHHVSMLRSEDEKEALAASFRRGCTVDLKPSLVLEEPLAVAIQKAYLADTDPARVDFFGSWYGVPWVGVFAKTLFGPVHATLAGGGTLDEAFARRAGRGCAQIAAAAAELNGSR